MTSNRINQIMTLMQRHGIAEFDFEHGETRIHLSRSDHQAASVLASGSPDGNPMIRSPGIGRLRLAHPSLADQTPSLPRRVKQGEIVAYLAAAPCCGRCWWTATARSRRFSQMTARSSAMTIRCFLFETSA